MAWPGKDVVGCVRSELEKGYPWRQLVLAYSHLTGIENGYGFFAPNVPSSYQLVFEVHRANAEIETELPGVTSAAAGLRLAGLLENVGRLEVEPLQRRTLLTLAYPVWREYPDATLIRATLRIGRLPDLAESLRGQKESYLPLCSYDLVPPKTERPP